METVGLYSSLFCAFRTGEVLEEVMMGRKLLRVPPQGQSTAVEPTGPGVSRNVMMEEVVSGDEQTTGRMICVFRPVGR